MKTNMFIYDLIHIPTGASLVENFLNQEESHLDSDYYLLYNRDEQPEWSDVAYDTWLLLTSKYIANLAGMACFFSDIFLGDPLALPETEEVTSFMKRCSLSDFLLIEYSRSPLLADVPDCYGMSTDEFFRWAKKDPATTYAKFMTACEEFGRSAHNIFT